MRVLRALSDGRAVVECDGVERVVDVSLVGAWAPGDHVIVHAGFAIERLDAAEAEAQLHLFQALAASRSPAADPGSQ